MATLPPLFHLVPLADWEKLEASGEDYLPATYDADGFTHMTEDASVLLTVANHFYTDIPGEFIVLTCDQAKLKGEVKYEPAAPVGEKETYEKPPAEDEPLFPHLYGPIELASVTAKLAVARDADGKFLSIAFEAVASPEVKERFGGKRVLITGCSRGLGLGLAHHFVDAGAVVIATCRSPDSAPELAAIVAAGAAGSCVLPCDVTDSASVAALAASTKELLKDGEAVDFLINNAGIASPNHPNDPILGASAEDISSVFQTNVVGSVLVTQAMLPMMEGGLKMVMNLSSQLGSIEKTWGIQGRYGGVASYRISRAANNMAMRTFAGELKDDGFTFVAMSPGHVATDMGSAGGRSPPLTVDQSVRGMAEVMAKSNPEEHNGQFLQFDGTTLPW